MIEKKFDVMANRAAISQNQSNRLFENELHSENCLKRIFIIHDAFRVDIYEMSRNSRDLNCNSRMPFRVDFSSRR